MFITMTHQNSLKHSVMMMMTTNYPVYLQSIIVSSDIF